MASCIVCFDDTPQLRTADDFFKEGKFTEAEQLYAKTLATKPNDVHALISSGAVALYGNRLGEAEEWLKNALKLQPGQITAKALLAECFYRRDDFSDAAARLRAIGQEANAKKLESFAGMTPYALETTKPVTSLKFIVTDPLPLVRVSVNGSAPVNFTIDTGAGEVILDPDFAKQVGVESFGGTTGVFAGGRQAEVRQGHLASLKLGDFTVKNLPVAILNTRSLSKPIFAGKQVDGIIGTVLLYHFLSTLDYANGQLILAQKTPENLSPFDARIRNGKAKPIPFWMAGDHYMVAWGKVEKSQPVFFFVDTGLAGGGVTLAKSTLEAAGIKLQEDQAGEGIGGGGKVRVVPFEVSELSLGDVREKHVRGLFTGIFPVEHSLGFHIGGLISHGFFRHHALTFDFTNMRLIVE
jgi:predicted aspartyl protease